MTILRWNISPLLRHAVINLSQKSAKLVCQSLPNSQTQQYPMPKHSRPIGYLKITITVLIEIREYYLHSEVYLYKHL